MKNVTKKILSVILLILLGVGGRIFFVNYIGIPNFEVVSSFALLSGFFLGGIFSFLAPLLIIFLSDLFIGNTSVMLFTWSAFGIIGLMGLAIKKGSFGKIILQAPIFAILASCFFFIYTNFGWWVLSGMYPHTLSGLISCYANGLLFFRNNLLGNFILAPLVFGAFFVFKSLNLRIIKKYDFIRQGH
jgi:hypothetical protein